MDWIVAIVMVCVCIVVIAYASNLITNELPGVIKRAGLPAAIVSIVGIGIATGLPEILTSLSAVAVGDIYMIAPSMVGSSLMHFMIIGLIALVSPVLLTREINVGLIATTCIGSVLFVLALLFNVLSYIPVIFLLVFFGLYIGIALRFSSHDTMKGIKGGNTAKAVLGIVLLFIASFWFVYGIDVIVDALGIAISDMGYFLTGFAANLPEFIIIGSAVSKSEPELAVAGALSGNIINISLGIGLSGILAPLPIQSVPLQVAFGGLIFIALVTLIMFWTGRKISIYEALAIIGSYVLISTIFILV